MTEENQKADARIPRNVMVVGMGERNLAEEQFYNVKSRCLSLLEFMLNHQLKVEQFSTQIAPLENKLSHARRLLGMLKGLKDDFESGMLIYQPQLPPVANLASLAHVFLSYSTDDLTFVRQLRSNLEELGFNIWMDEKRLQPSVNWWDEIEEKIDTCAAFIVVMSESSRKSFYVNAELQRAIAKKKGIYPILLNGDGFSLLAPLQYEDMRSGGSTNLSDNFIKSLRERVPLGEKSNIVEERTKNWDLPQIRRFLDDKKQENLSYVPAAVLAGAILEDALRELCQRQNPPIPIEKPNGQPKTLAPLIDDLRKANVINELKAKQLRSWADIRNAAAHGKFDDFTLGDVELMLAGIQKFVADYL